MKRIIALLSVLSVILIICYFMWMPFRLLYNYKEYYDDSNTLTKVEYKNFDEKVVMHFYPNGHYKFIERLNKENNRIGLFTTHFSDGSPKDTVHYNNGLKNGIEVQYDSSGLMSYWAYYIMDSLHKEFIFCYDSLGEISEILANEFYLDGDHDLPDAISILEDLLRQQKSH